MPEFICGKTAHGKTHVVRGGTCYFHSFSVTEMCSPELYEEKPRQPAYTAMNNNWEKRKR